MTDITDEMLPETECPGRAVTVLEVSLDTRDNGRGMNSKVSENPTLLRAWGLIGGSNSDARDGVPLPILSPAISGIGEGTRSGTDGAAFGTGNTSLSGSIAGLAGALLPRRFWLGDGRMIEARSWLEIAADLR